ncbi:hypothetical protein B0O99DRAFT_676007 [Bisporella sp. PMI_857]|nr:hypothetical protein B0O99DRAFT_676007 [Bisporella sp. PMI_857]
MALSFLHAIRAFGDGHQEIRRFLATLLVTETPVERPSIEYWVRRIKYKLSHRESSLRQHYCWWTFVLAIFDLRGLWTALTGLILLHQARPLTAQP